MFKKRKKIDLNQYQRRPRGKKRKKILLIVLILLTLYLIYILIPYLNFQTKREDIKKYEQIGIFCKENSLQENKCFYVDKQGVIFEDAPRTSGGLVLLIKDYSDKEIKLYDQVLNLETINMITEIKNYLSSEIGLSAVSFDIDSYPVNKLRVVTNESWYVLFGLKQEIKKQLLSLKVVLDEKIEDRMSLQYIDLRIENRIYYK